MADNYNPPIRGKAFVCYVSLPSQGDPRLHQNNPTLAAGDVKISKDGGATANLTTLPTVTPASGPFVKVSLSATEMTADNVAVRFSDASGAEWCDFTINIQPTSIAVAGTVNNSGVDATTLTFKTSLTQTTGLFDNAFIIFTDGALQGESRKISTYVSTNGVIVLATALTAAPADGVGFLILGGSQ